MKYAQLIPSSSLSPSSLSFLPLQRHQAPSRLLLPLPSGVFWAVSLKQGLEGPLLLEPNGQAVTHSSLACLSSEESLLTQGPTRHLLSLFLGRHSRSLCSYGFICFIRESPWGMEGTKHLFSRQEGQFSVFNLCISKEENVTVRYSAGDACLVWRSWWDPELEALTSKARGEYLYSKWGFSSEILSILSSWKILQLCQVTLSEAICKWPLCPRSNWCCLPFCSCDRRGTLQVRGSPMPLPSVGLVWRCCTCPCKCQAYPTVLPPRKLLHPTYTLSSVVVSSPFIYSVKSILIFFFFSDSPRRTPQFHSESYLLMPIVLMCWGEWCEVPLCLAGCCSILRAWELSQWCNSQGLMPASIFQAKSIISSAVMAKYHTGSQNAM